MTDKFNNVGTMTIEGIQRPFQIVSTIQNFAFCELRGVSDPKNYFNELAKIATSGPLTQFEIGVDFVYSALFAGAKKHKIPLDFTRDDVYNWVSEAPVGSEIEAELAKPMAMLVEMMPKPEENIQEATEEPGK